MSKLNIQDVTSPKQHGQNDEVLMVVESNHGVIEKVKEQECHTKIKLTHQEI